MSLVKKNVLITGASRGLGKELARYLWDKGANLILVSKNLDVLRCTLNDLTVRYKQKVEYIPCDLGDENSLLNLIENLKNIEIDAIINNAAIQGPIGALQSNDWSEWRQTIQVNLLSPVFICHSLIPQMLARKLPGGSIINLSGGGVTAPRPNFSAYATAKSGLVSFTATLAEELKDTNIRVNSIAPGPMPTDMLQKVLESGESNAGNNEIRSAEKIFNQSTNSFLLVAELCEFLISEKSRNITGKLISALWDKWEDFDKLPLEVVNSDIYTLRRIVEYDRAEFLSKFKVATLLPGGKSVH